MEKELRGVERMRTWLPDDIVGSVWAWLSRHRAALADAVRREAAACDAVALPVETPASVLEPGRPLPSRVWYESEEVRHGSEARE